MFSRAPFHNRCKPGLSHFGTGLNLRRAAAEARAQFGQVLASGTTANAVSGAENAIVEAFPNAFLGVLLPDRDFGTAPKLRRGERFDWLYARIVMGGKLQKILSTELKLPDIVWQRLKEESDHELRAALICLLTAALAHRGMAHVVGNEETGWFWLPPKRVWQSWAIKGLTQSGSKNKAFEPIRSDSPLLQERVLVKEIKILKGNRITIPREVRESLAVKEGDKIRITVQGKVMVLTKPKQRDGNRRS